MSQNPIIIYSLDLPHDPVLDQNGTFTRPWYMFFDTIIRVISGEYTLSRTQGSTVSAIASDAVSLNSRLEIVESDTSTIDSEITIMDSELTDASSTIVVLDSSVSELSSTVTEIDTDVESLAVAVHQIIITCC